MLLAIGGSCAGGGAGADSSESSYVFVSTTSAIWNALVVAHIPAQFDSWPEKLLKVPFIGYH